MLLNVVMKIANNLRQEEQKILDFYAIKISYKGYRFKIQG